MQSGDCTSNLSLGVDGRGVASISEAFVAVGS